MAETFKMVAVREFDGLEGIKLPGNEFEVKSKSRADGLKNAGLADYKKKAALEKAAK